MSWWLRLEVLEPRTNEGHPSLCGGISLNPCKQPAIPEPIVKPISSRPSYDCSQLASTSPTQLEQQRSITSNMAVHDHKHTHGHGHAHEHCLKMARREDGTPWWTDFPEPTSLATHVEPACVLRLLQEHDALAGKPRDFLLVDARRSDCTGGTVRGAVNLPAHSFYPTRQSLYGLCKQAGIKRVIFYCGES